MKLITKRKTVDKKLASLCINDFFGGDGRDRTVDLLNAIQALSQLSYAPVKMQYYQGNQKLST